MSKGNTTEADFIAYTFNATAISWNASAILYVSLHTADPGEAGVQTTNEADYTGYARVAVTRNGAGWTVSTNTASNAAEVTFPECTGGANTITHVAIGLASSGGSQILYKGALTASLEVSNLITPRFPIGTLTVSED